MSQANIPSPSKFKKYYEKNKEVIKAKNAEINRRRRTKMGSTPAQINDTIQSRNQGTLEHADIGVQTDPVNDSLANVMEEYWKSPAYPDFSDLFTVMKKKVTGPSNNLITLPDGLEAIQPDFPQYLQFLKLREKVQKWTSPWGGIASWADTFEILLSRAIDRGPERILKLVERLWVHELAGKQLLRNLQDIEGYLPNNHTAVKILWTYQQEQVIEIVQGLTIIQTRLPIIRRSLYGIGRAGNFHEIILQSFDANSPMPDPVIGEKDREEEEQIQRALFEL